MRRVEVLKYTFIATLVALNLMAFDFVQKKPVEVATDNLSIGSDYLETAQPPNECFKNFQRILDLRENHHEITTLKKLQQDADRHLGDVVGRSGGGRYFPRQYTPTSIEADLDARIL